MKYRTEPTFSI